MPSSAPPDRLSPLRRAVALAGGSAAALAGVCAVLLLIPAAHEGNVVGTGAFLLHAVLFLAGIPIVAARRPAGTARLCLALGSMLTLLLAAAWFLTGSAAAGVAHGVAGFLTLALAGYTGMSGRAAVARWGVAVLVLLPLLGYASVLRARSAWSPPRYDADACYRFLTASVPEQADEPHFPSALRLEGAFAAASPVSTERYSGVHSESASNPAYRAARADFTRRKGAAAARWCRGCHEPASLVAEGPGFGAQGSGNGAHSNPGSCDSCHAARDVHALYGNAALKMAGRKAEGVPPAARLRPAARAEARFRSPMLRSAEFCGSCHRKNWSLPQNGYRWMPGPDEYREWQTGPHSGATLFAVGEPRRAQTCQGCHDPHARRGASAKPAPPPLELDLFIRRPAQGGEAVVPLDEAPAPAPGEEALLDVVVRNRGIGHTFPTGMPDLHEAWLEVRVEDGSARPLLHSGKAGRQGEIDPAAHFYRLVALDRRGLPLRHGELDEMVQTAEWRRIPAGGADLARYRLRVPRGGLGAVSVRLLRRRRPDFSRWAGEPVRSVEVLASTRVEGSGEGPGQAAQSKIQNPKSKIAKRWRSYGLALAGVKSYPQAVQALRRSLELAPGDAETVLSLGRVYLEEGDLLAARERFVEAGRKGAGPRALGWEGAVLRLMGRPEEAAGRLEPLARRYPRDLRLRFELGKIHMAELRNEEAAREFRAMLDVDPTDLSAHYNLMLCLQRLNRLTEARKEEVIYRLLAPDDRPAVSAPGGGAREDRPLHVHTLE